MSRRSLCTDTFGGREYTPMSHRSLCTDSYCGRECRVKTHRSLCSTVVGGHVRNVLFPTFRARTVPLLLAVLASWCVRHHQSHQRQLQKRSHRQLLIVSCLSDTPSSTTSFVLHYFPIHLRGGG
jgi:hypothetical protein